MTTQYAPARASSANNSSRTLLHPEMHLLLLFNRLTLGWYLAWAGFTKVRDEIGDGLGTFYRGGSFQDRNPSWVPEFLMALRVCPAVGGTDFWRVSPDRFVQPDLRRRETR